jgi:hypothetical protein
MPLCVGNSSACFASRPRRFRSAQSPEVAARRPRTSCERQMDALRAQHLPREHEYLLVRGWEIRRAGPLRSRPPGYSRIVSTGQRSLSNACLTMTDFGVYRYSFQQIVYHARCNLQPAHALFQAVCPWILIAASRLYSKGRRFRGWRGVRAGSIRLCDH